MAFQVSISVWGDEIVSRKLLRFAERASNMMPAWDDVEDQLKVAFERNFQAQGPGWAPLKPSTVRSRIAQGYAPGPILTRGGDYRRAMTQGLKTHKNPSELIALAPEVPGAYHQHGTRRMPSRPLRLRETDKRAIIKTIQRALMEGYE
jgi:phage gpG-like protein